MSCEHTAPVSAEDGWKQLTGLDGEKEEKKVVLSVLLNYGIRSLTGQRFTACWVSEVCSQSYAAEGKLWHMFPLTLEQEAAGSYS